MRRASIFVASFFGTCSLILVIVMIQGAKIISTNSAKTLRSE